MKNWRLYEPSHQGWTFRSFINNWFLDPYLVSTTTVSSRSSCGPQKRALLKGIGRHTDWGKSYSVGWGAFGGWVAGCTVPRACVCVLLRQVKMSVCAADWFVLMGWRLVKKMSSSKNGPRNAGIWTQDLPISNPMLYNWAHSPCVGSKYFTDLLLNSNSVNFIL